MGVKRDKLVSVLAFMSGICGLAYEVLYARLMSALLGDMFYVSAAVLAAFLGGMAVGSLVAPRYARYLYIVEALIGLYGAVVALLSHSYSSEMLVAINAVVGKSAFLKVALVFAFLAIPAFLMGCSVPMFSLYLEHHSGSGPAKAFDRAYLLYNLGAGTSVLAIEFWSLRNLGVSWTLVGVALVNLTTAILLKAFISPVGPRPRAPLQFTLETTSLFLASVLSGLFQLFFLKLSETFFGPYHEHFAIVVASGLFGIATGTSLVSRFDLDLTRWLKVGAFLIVASAILWIGWLWLWAFSNTLANVFGFSSTPVKVVVLVAMGAVPYAVLGGTVPAFLRLGSYGAAEGLFWSSLGNAVGYLAVVLILHEILGLFGLLVVCVFGLFLLALLLRKTDRRLKTFLSVGSAIVFLFLLWPSDLYRRSYREFRTLESIASAFSNAETITEVRRFGTQVALVHLKDGGRDLIIDGYHSLSFEQGRPILTEAVVGLSVALLAPSDEKALVLGVGTGMTAGAVGQVFKDVDAVEVSPAVMEMLGLFSDVNFDLVQNPRVRLILDDGLSFLAHTTARYDAIVNTVTTPLFFASSKLYTLEFFKLVKSHLNPGGVYGFWLDSRVGEEGARIVYATMRQVFDYCAVTYLRASYHQVLCSDEPLRLRRRTFGPMVQEVFTSFGLSPPEEAVASLIFPIDDLSSLEVGERVNTADFPVLEFTMSQRALLATETTFSPYEMLKIDPKATLFSRPLDLDGVTRRCLYMAALNRGKPQPLCLNLFSEYGLEGPPVTFLLGLLHLPFELPTSVYSETFLQLAKQGAFEQIHHEIERLLERKRDLAKVPRVQFLRVLSRLKTFGKVTDEDLLSLVAMDPLSTDIRALVVEALGSGGREDLALEHAKVLKRMKGEAEAR